MIPNHSKVYLPLTLSKWHATTRQRQLKQNKKRLSHQTLNFFFNFSSAFPDICCKLYQNYANAISSEVATENSNILPKILKIQRILRIQGIPLLFYILWKIFGEVLNICPDHEVFLFSQLLYSTGSYQNETFRFLISICTHRNYSVVTYRTYKLKNRIFKISPYRKPL